MAKYNGSEYVFQLPPAVCESVRRAVRARLSRDGISGEELREYVDDATNSRLRDLEELIDWRKYVKMANEGAVAKKKPTVKKKTTVKAPAKKKAAPRRK